MKSIKQRVHGLLRRGLAVSLAAMPLFAQASIECNVTVYRYFIGDEGSLWVTWKEGGAGLIRQSDPDFKPTLLTVTAALLGNRQLTVRYEDGQSCTGVPVSIIGIWLW